MRSARKVEAGPELCRWIEFNIRFIADGMEEIMIRKLLIPEKCLEPDENPMQHVIRGWSKSAGEDTIEKAIPFHGYWPAHLAGPLSDEKKLSKKIVESRLGSLKCDGLTGWIEYTDDIGFVRKVRFSFSVCQ